MTVEKQIELLKAFKDGKTVLRRKKSKNSEWEQVTDGMDWNFANYNYQLDNYNPDEMMTILQLAEWLAKGCGYYFDEDASQVICQTNLPFSKEYSQDPVGRSVKIVAWDSDKEMIPTKDIYYKDCSPRKDDFEERFVECLNKYMRKS